MAHSSPRQARVFVLSVSDSRTPEDDHNRTICKEIAEKFGHEITGYALIPNDPARVVEECRRAAAEHDAVLITGGTGISAKDVTYEAIAALIDQPLDGFGELFRMLSFQEIGSKAMASRAQAGLINQEGGRALLFSMPGSNKAVRLAMERLIGPELGHLVGELRK